MVCLGIHKKIKTIQVETVIVDNIKNFSTLKLYYANYLQYRRTVQHQGKA